MGEHAKSQAEGKATGPALLQAYSAGVTAAAQLLAITRKGARGELLIDKALEILSKAMQKLAAAALFAEANQLPHNDEAAKEPLLSLLQRVQVRLSPTLPL